MQGKDSGLTVVGQGIVNLKGKLIFFPRLGGESVGICHWICPSRAVTLC